VSKAYEAGKEVGYREGHATVTASHWADYCKLVREDGLTHDWPAERQEFERGMADGYAQWKAEHPYTVNLWGSKPGTNDDCWTGDDFATRAEAEAVYANPEAHFSAQHTRGVAWFQIDGPDIHEERENPAYNTREAERQRALDDAADRSERAMQAGMGLGVHAFNEEMGGDVENPPADIDHHGHY
jgi:hypothetical protein